MSILEKLRNSQGISWEEKGRNSEQQRRQTIINYCISSYSNIGKFDWGKTPQIVIVKTFASWEDVENVFLLESGHHYYSPVKPCLNLDYNHTLMDPISVVLIITRVHMDLLIIRMYIIGR